VIEEVRRMVPAHREDTGGLYELMLDYPLRPGKAIRPALSIAVCRGAGGSLSSVLPTAAVLELYHNAFLVHDDVEDRSFKRRHEPTLNRLHGMPVAVNVGDGMLALAIRPLLDNIGVVGLGKALKILRVVARMARETAEGQMLELGWIKSGRWLHADADYIRLVHKKTAWYSFVAPMMVGAIAAGLPDDQASSFGRAGIPLGIAFQVRDDILNLATASGDYGKDACADLWEGKRTLILMHALRTAPARQRARALKIVAKPQPTDHAAEASWGDVDVLARRLAGSKVGVNASDVERVLRAVDRLLKKRRDTAAKTAGDVAFLRELIERQGSIAYARRIAERHARRFRSHLGRLLAAWPSSEHRDFLFALGDYTVQRTV
jgi:geranylgeranyl diphosphate synthase type II